MKFSSVFIYAPVLGLSLSLGANASATSDTFEIIDGHANVAGRPNSSSTQARQNWEAACEQWKSETKDLNRNDQMMMISCDTPVCSFDNGYYTCSSNANFKVKTAGTLAQPQPQPVITPVSTPEPVIEQTVVETAPPPVIYETVPAPRPGFIWITGYWGWRSHRHYWVGGHWESHRPGYAYVSPRWVHYGHNWRLEPGRWHR